MACLPPGSHWTLLLFVLFSTTISAVSNLVGILPAESFPTDIRSLGVGFATAMSRLGAAISTGLLPWILAQWGMTVTLLLLAGVLLMGFTVTWLWAPETKALPLVAAGSGDKRQGGPMNILLAFKAEPDAGMLAEKDWQAAAQDPAGRMFRYCAAPSVPMSRPPPRCCWPSAMRAVR
jgi:hypothetical protein